MLCFNVGDQESLTSAINKWCIEIRRHCRITPIVLCGCRADTKSVYNTINYNSVQHGARIPVTSEQALLAANHIRAAAYVETSSQYANILVPESFKVAAEVALGLVNECLLTKPATKKMCKEKKSYSISSPTLNRLHCKPDIKNDVRMKTQKNCCIM